MNIFSTPLILVILSFFALFSPLSFAHISCSLFCYHLPLFVFPRFLGGFMEGPLMLVFCLVIYSNLPGAVVHLYMQALSLSAPIILFVEAVQIVSVIFFTSRSFTQRITAGAGTSAKATVLALAIASYAVAACVLYKLYTHANLSVWTASWISCIATLLVVLSVVTVAHEEGIITDSAFLSAFVLYILWVALNHVEGPAPPIELPSWRDYESLDAIASRLAATTLDLITAAPATLATTILSFELLSTLFFTSIAILSIPLDLNPRDPLLLWSQGGFHAKSKLRWLMGSEANAAARMTVARMLIIVVFSTFHSGVVRSITSWRLLEAFVAMVVFTRRLLVKPRR